MGAVHSSRFTSFIGRVEAGRGYLQGDRQGVRLLAEIVESEPQVTEGRSAEGGASLKALIEISVLAEDLVRVRAKRVAVLPGDAEEVLGEPWPSRSWAVVKDEWPWIPVLHWDHSDRFELSTPAMTVVIHKDPFSLEFRRPDGSVIASTASGRSIGWLGEQFRVWHLMPEDERYFGLGEKMGPLDKRDRAVVQWATDSIPHLPDTDPMYQAIPMFIGLRRGQAYGMFLDNTRMSYFDMGKEGSLDGYYYFGADGGDLDFYFFAGPDVKRVLSRYTELTGRMPLPPLWAIGYQQSRYSYMSSDEVRRIARELRERQIPCDVIYLDIDYMDGYRVFTWDCKRFPDPEKLIEDLERDGFKVVTIVDPGVKVDPDYHVYKDGSARRYFCTYPNGEEYHGQVWPGTSAFPDFTSPEVRTWWAEQHAALLGKGVAGIWNDMNEPAIFDTKSKTMPVEVRHMGPDGRPAGPRDLEHAEVHNVYALLMAQATREAFERFRPGKRAFLVTRAGFSGIQRYAAVWTGDNSSWWEHLQAAMTTCLGMGLSGVPFVGTDVGGFLADATGELLVRWIQLGAFTPFFRNHAAVGTRAQEPWAFGPEYESITRTYIGMRYRLMPYVYTLFREASETGLPLMRPLFMEYPGDEEAVRVSDEFLFGRDILVAPVYQHDARHRAVYLPEGSWIQVVPGQGARPRGPVFRAVKEYTGPGWVVVDAPLDVLPTFVRRGAIIPTTSLFSHAGERKEDALFLEVFPGDAGEAEVYEDDGESLAYREGAWMVSRFAYRWEGNTFVLTRDVERGRSQAPDEAGEADMAAGVQPAYAPRRESVRLVLHVSDAAAPGIGKAGSRESGSGVPLSAPVSVIVDGEVRALPAAGSSTSEGGTFELDMDERAREVRIEFADR